MPYHDITNALRDPSRISNDAVLPAIQWEWVVLQTNNKKNNVLLCLRPNMVLDQSRDMTSLSTVAFSWCKSDPGLCMSNGSATCSLRGAENFSERQTSLADTGGAGTQAGVLYTHTLTNTHLTDFPLKFAVSSHGGGNDVKWGKSRRRQRRWGGGRLWFIG